VIYEVTTTLYTFEYRAMVSYVYNVVCGGQVILEGGQG